MTSSSSSSAGEREVEGYALGIDLGTTFTSAAVRRGGRSTIVELGTRSAAAPSVVLLRSDETVLAGEAADRRATTEPNRVAREFKRRLGDPTPLLLGGTPYSADALTGRMLRWVVDQVEAREGGRPAAVAVTHPANWGPFKIDLLEQAVRHAGLSDVTFLTEPEAAVRHYASQQRVEPGSVVAVYDLGGGTFDTAILRKVSEDEFELLGRPEGIERLGGIDFDAAVLGHVMRALDGAVEALEPDEPATLQALSRLRKDCIEAKEALSTDTDASVPVLLPTVATEVRLTRSELEGMVRPALTHTLDAMRRAMTSAGITEADVSAVLLVGGSSRMPIVAQMVSNELGRPVAVDADPKHAVALGASAAAEAAMRDRHEVLAADVPAAASAAPVASVADPPPAPVTAGPPAAPSTVRPTPEPASAPVGSPSSGGTARSRAPLLAGVGLALVVALLAAWLVVRGTGDPEPARAGTAVDRPQHDDSTLAGEGQEDEEPPGDPSTTGQAGAVVATPEPTVDGPPPSTPGGPAVTPCPTDQPATACIVGVEVDADGGLVATYVTDGYTPELEPVQDHIHFYFDTVVGGDERNAGTAGSGGDWRLWDGPNPFTATGGEQGRTGYTLAEGRAVGATQLCSVVADHHHAVRPGTGNCIELPEP